jgi:ATP-dependent RNA helicase DeaD
MINFEALGLQGDLLKGIQDLGFETPTPIQEQSIPVLLSGEKDFIGLAQTGTGKTAAFGLPLLSLLDFNSKSTQALILAPTRELCMQIGKDIENFGKHIDGLRIVAVYGGASIVNQIRDVKRGAQIITATPGRLLDMIDRRAVDISKIKVVVLDEADEMLNMGFQEDIDSILSNTPDDKNTWLFSATMPAEVRRIAQNYMTNPFELTVGKKNAGAENIEHIYYVVSARDRYLALKRIVDFNPDIFGIVFCRTKIESQNIAEQLIKDGYNADALHGDLSQQQRDKVMGRFRDRSLQMLIATDVAARGIDVSNITHIINYELPDEIENYTHRSGRTARAGKSGVSISIINQKEINKIRQLEKVLNKKFTFGKIPDGFDVCEKQLFHLINRVHTVEVNEKAIESYLPKIYEELEELSKEEVIKRFASLEFNRFLDYYRNAPDINIDLSRRDHGRSESMRSGTRMFISLGAVDGFDNGKMLRYICDTSGIEGNAVGRIDIKGVYSFIDVDNTLAEKVMESFKGEVYNSRPVRVDISSGGGKQGGSSGGNRKRFEGNKSYGDRKKSYSSSGDNNRNRDDKKSYGRKERHRY